jgi:hypothetical protein
MHLKRKRTTRSLLVTVSMLFIAACASSPPVPQVDYNPTFNFSGIKTLAFDETTSSGDSVRALLSDIEISRINAALTGAMEAKGFQIVKDKAQADALINWHLVARDKQDVRTHTTPATYGSYGRYNRYNRAAYYNCWNCVNTEVYVYDYTEGTFVVDIIDPTLKQSVWRSVTQSRLKGELKRDPATYPSAAQRIMSAFPPI